MKQFAHRLKLSIVATALASTLVAVGGVALAGTALAASQTLVATTAVNLRSGPGTEFGILAVVQEGDSVTSAGETSGTWTVVTYKGLKGYVASAYVASGSGAGANSGGSATTTTPRRVATNATVNVRTGPGLGYAVVTQLSPGAKLETTGVIVGDWTQVDIDGVYRWIVTSFLTAADSDASGTTTYGRVRTTDTVNMRAEGFLGAPIVGVLPVNSIVDVTGQTTDTYTQILYQGVKAWISSKYTTSATSSPVPIDDGSGSVLSTVTSKQAKVVAYVTSKLGDAYVWGAEGPDEFDCSGLTMLAYRQIGIDLPHHAADQITLGTAVSRDNLQPGDLLFWYTPVGHVSMYIGNGQMIHARGTAWGVVQQSVDSYVNGGGEYVGARRYIG